MSGFHWRKEFHLGVAELDDPHRRMIALAAEIARCLRTGAAKDETVERVRALTDFAAWHFMEEEKLMVATGFEGSHVHAEQHGELLGQLERFAQRVLSHNCSLESNKMLAFLRHWVAHHIMHSDREIARHVLSQGEKINVD